METGVVQIMWKEIVIIWIAAFIILALSEFYLISKCKKINKLYGKAEDKIVKEKAKRHLKLCEILPFGVSNKPRCFVYNNLCWILASLELVEGNENQFLQYINDIRKEHDFEAKSFALALYYRSKGNESQAEKHYENCLKCNHINKNAYIILEYLFEGQKDDEEFNMAVESFKNQAVIKLLKNNGIHS